MTARAPRTVPLLASDVARSWLAVLVGMPVLFSVPVIAGLAPDLLGLRDVDRTSLMSGTFYIGWTAFCLVAVIATVVTFRRADAAQLRRWLQATRAPDGFLRRMSWVLNGGGAISWAISGSLIALLALLEVALSGRDMPVAFVIAGVAVVPSSIAVIVVTFAVSHARADRDGAFDFPGTDAPVFDDYLYLSIQLTATFGGSDVAATTTRLRRAISVHSLVAFSYNAFVIALLVSAILNAVPQ